jgi:transposase InsO family protein
MRTWCARTCWPRKGWRSAGERCNALCSRIARRLKAEALATTRFETPPGRQLQIDFGERLVEIGGAKIKAFVFVATLGHSRRLHVRAFRAEKQEHWFAGLESAFTVFGGVPEEVLMEIRALVVRHDAVSRSVQFNDKLIGFAKHWGFAPRACAPYRARMKGKTESGVGYVKKNAIAGHSFASWEAFEAHLAEWEREVANVRIHGTTGKTPIARFERDEAHRLKPLGGRSSFGSLRELSRVVGNDCAVDIDTNSYSVPWRLIGERVAVTVAAGGGVREVAVHKQSEGRRLRIVDGAHLDGVAGHDGAVCRPEIATLTAPTSSPPPSLLRPLAEYEAAIGGSF